MDAVSLVLTLILIMAVVVTCVVIYRYRKRQARSTIEDARRQAKEEQKHLEEEARGKAEEEQKRLEEEARRREEKNRGKAKEEERRRGEEESRRLEPGKIPGKRRRRRKGREQRKREKAERKSRRRRPEIVCWEEGWSWIIGVEVPEDLLEDPDLSVLHDEELLTPDEFCEERYRLKRLYGKVRVLPSKDEVPIEIDPVEGDKHCLLFRLGGYHERKGRRIRQATSGRYLVVVPDGWERDEEVSGPPPVNPEPVSIDGYRAHFFYLSRDDAKKIAFVTPEGEKIEIETGTTRFELVGTPLNDSSEGIGPLFGGGPPRIRALHKQGWRNIRTVIVGEEGGGKKGWHTQFIPDKDQVEQHLPAEVAKRNGGWYFVRFYDANDNLVESLDFRFMSALEEIRVLDHPFLPSAGGHTVVDVEFLHQPNCEVRLTEGPANSLQIVHEKSENEHSHPP